MFEILNSIPVNVGWMMVGCAMTLLTLIVAKTAIEIIKEKVEERREESCEV